MFERITEWFKHHEPTSADLLVLIREAIARLDPAEIAALKVIVAELDKVDAVVDAVVDADVKPNLPA